MTHERRVQRFYARGVERYGDFHDNYLNFGLWRSAGLDYVAAAQALLAAVAETVDLARDSAVLDAACGMGTQDRFLVERYGCCIEAVDLTPEHIAVASRKHSLTKVRYRVADACRLPFEARTFTHVIAIEGIVHFRTRRRFFEEAYRVLAPGGRLGVSDFFLRRAPRGLLERALLRAGTAAWHVPPENISTLERYRDALERAGFVEASFEDVSVDTIPGYLQEQARPQIRRRSYAIRGQVIGRLATALDRLVLGLYRAGLVGYVIAHGRKPG